MMRPDRGQALAALRARASERVLAHSLRVEAQAAELARAYGIDAEAASLAGLLHDWSKSASDEALLARAVSLGVPVSETDRERPSLLHAPVGAAELVLTWPDLDPAIAQAVARHTYGAAGMTPLDMVVYVADTIEPSRRFDGVAELRAAVGQVPLGELYLRVFAGSLHHLLDARAPIHPATVAGWNHAVAGERP